MGAITETLNSVMGLVENHWIATLGVAILAEVVLKLKPTSKPVGILIFVGKITGLIGNLFLKINAIIEKIVPQKIKEPKDK